ncbi:serine protease HTRA2, mitochondrial-like [Dendroctonus ponderosae]|uniref:serine protease HTRA2, mitochondrial-like n=1 Tax=Dendroctonus ponderosae TaxID=77166 RepID=UPI0020351F4F|nr:serine protease HTRA2, mitochondrial-like [Dendroctonus ponderosae]KAH1008858.1 hypothetical protein HUJ05_009361 [Dendroctonus ponderosae]
MLKFPCSLLTKNIQKALATRPYSRDKSGPNKTAPKSLNKANIYGTVGIASALLTSYLILKNSYNKETSSLHLTKKPPRRAIPHSDLMNQRPVSNVEGDLKDEHLREQYNFIKKVVNECASAVFYLELRDPQIKDPETGQPLVTSNGSGFVISEDGWALTNAHVVLNKPQSTITAIMRDGKTYNVTVEDADMNIDLALLRVEANEKLPTLQFGDTGDTSIGEWVVALGSPLSLSNSVTVGIISSVDRPAEELGLKNYSMTYIQTDASITFGNSGGPLVNLDGHVIGINNLRLTSGISFAIPVEYAKKFLENSKFRLNASNGDRIGQALFGLTTISITPELLVELSKENRIMPKDITHGLLVWKVIPGTSAFKSGLEAGDIITHVNGIPVQKPMELYNFSSSRNALEIGVINKGKQKTVTLHLS